jgi:[protein-PII] uridylyltransferase
VLAQAAAGDLTIQTALLEARLLIGSEAVPGTSAKLATVLDPQASSKPSGANRTNATCATTDRPTAWNPTARKAPGGLRDLQTILWIATCGGLRQDLGDLAQYGFLTHEEEDAAATQPQVPAALRTRLHLHVGRREDRLLFDYQTALAEQLGFYRATDPPRQRAADAALLSHGEGSHADQHHPAAQYRRRHIAAGRSATATADQ